MSNLTPAVTEEIETLHVFFVDWYAGALPETAIDEVLGKRLDRDIVFVSPGGTILDYDTLMSAIRDGYGRTPTSALRSGTSGSAERPTT